MTDDSDGMDRYLGAVTQELDALADLVLVEGLSPTAPEHDLTVPWAHDREALQRELGTDEPVAWISHTVGWYLAEAAHELRAISVLLRARTVTGSLGPLVRAVVERVGVTAWILDVEKTDSTERAWRAMLKRPCLRERVPQDSGPAWCVELRQA